MGVNKYRNKELYKKLLRYVFSVMLIASQTACFGRVWLTEYNPNIVWPFFEKGNWLFFAVYAILFVVFLLCFDGLKYGLYRKFNLLLGQWLATIGATFIVYLQIAMLSLRFVNPVPLLWSMVVNLALCVILTLLSEWLIHTLFPAKRLLVICDSYPPDQFLQKMSGRRDKYRVSEIINVSEGLEALEEKIKQAENVLVYDVHSEMRNKLLKMCYEYDVRAYSTTKVSDILIRGAERIHIFDTPLLLYRNIGLTIEQRFFKRFMDIVVSLLLLILTSPFLLIAAVAIKLYDGGPVFFLQDRCTLNGKVFKIHKFRSMIVDAEKEGISVPAGEKDPRITPVGRVLRATRLDELPQLIDILVGNMSLVGPRPERVEHVEKYTEEIPEFKYRLKVRGGLTGYAQLYGKYNTSAYDKLQLDLMYIQNYSLLLDIRLILMTVKIMFMKESTEGFTEEQRKEVQEQNQESSQK
ncbi:MAG: sugar transferase [Clostridia bacterium]|nr:sugar transferase [Clostridia bacterium]